MSEKIKIKLDPDNEMQLRAFQWLTALCSYAHKDSVFLADFWGRLMEHEDVYEEFCYYMEDTLDETYLTPTDEANDYYAASVGYCYVAMTFTISNIDRGGSLDVCAGGWDILFTASYNGEEYPLRSFVLWDNGGNPYVFQLDTAVITDKTGKVADMKIVTGEEDLLVITDDATIIRMNVENISCLSRATQGVRIMRLAEGSRVISIECTEKAAAEAGTAAETAEE